MLRTPFRRPSSPALISSFSSQSGGPSGPEARANGGFELSNLRIIQTNCVLCWEPNPLTSTPKHSQRGGGDGVGGPAGDQFTSGCRQILKNAVGSLVLFWAPSPSSLHPSVTSPSPPRDFRAICISTRACCSSPATPPADEWSHLPQPLDSARPP